MRKKDHEKTLLLFDIITVDKTTTYENMLYTYVCCILHKDSVVNSFFIWNSFFSSTCCALVEPLKKEYDKNNGKKVIIRIRFWRYNIIRNY